MSGVLAWGKADSGQLGLRGEVMMMMLMILIMKKMIMIMLINLNVINTKFICMIVCE